MKLLNRLKLALWSSDPTVVEGELFYNSTLGQLKYKGSDTTPISLGVGAKFNDIGAARWYMTTSGAPTTSTPIANRVYAIPFMLNRSAQLTGIATEVVTAFTTAGTVRAGLYYGDITNSPTTLIADYSTVAATTGIKTWSMTQNLTAGSYFVAICYQGGSGGSPAFRTTSGQADYVGDVAATPASTYFNGAQNTYFSATTQSGALGASYGTVSGSTGGPRVAVRFG